VDIQRNLAILRHQVLTVLAAAQHINTKAVKGDKTHPLIVFIGEQWILIEFKKYLLVFCYCVYQFFTFTTQRLNMIGNLFT